MKLSREPALILGLVASVIQVVSSMIFPLTVGQQGALNAIAVAVLGLITAIVVKGDKLAPAILGFAQSAIALGVAFNFNWPAEDQAAVMALVSAGVAMFVRQIVTAPVPPVAARAVPTETDAAV